MTGCGSSAISTSIVCRRVGLFHHCQPFPSRWNTPPVHCPAQHSPYPWQVRTKGDFRAAPVQTVTRFKRQLERRSPVMCALFVHIHQGSFSSISPLHVSWMLGRSSPPLRWQFTIIRFDVGWKSSARVTQALLTFSYKCQSMIFKKLRT